MISTVSGELVVNFGELLMMEQMARKQFLVDLMARGWHTPGLTRNRSTLVTFE